MVGPVIWNGPGGSVLTLVMRVSGALTGVIMVVWLAELTRIAIRWVESVV
jgi:hypothetical protein